MKLNIKILIIVTMSFFIYFVLLATTIRYFVIATTIGLLFGYCGERLMLGVFDVRENEEIGETAIAGSFCGIFIGLPAIFILTNQNVPYEFIWLLLSIAIGSIISVIYKNYIKPTD